jgi:membrane associated rhomboid family serine protease
MRKTAITLASLAALTLFPSLASAQNRTAVGVGTGAVAGAVVGGSIGAAVGGVIGGVIGASTDQRRTRAYRSNRKPSCTSYRSSRRTVRQPARREAPSRSREFHPLG